MVIGRFLENSFGATLSSKTNVVSVWKVHFSVFCKSLSDEVEIIFWESAGKRSKLLKSKFGHTNLLRKWFWSYTDFKSECCDCLKRAFLSFLQIFEWRTIFLESEAKRSTLFKSNFGHRNLLTKFFWSYLELNSQSCVCLKIAFFSSFANFWLTNLKPHCVKVRQSVQSYLNQSLVIGSFLENRFELKTSLTWAQKRIFSAFEKRIFQFFPNFWVTKLKPFSGKVR